jgi:hypothetical protein
MIGQLVQWLANTHASYVIQTVSWLIPAVQTVHILTISAVMTAVALIHLRTFGIAVPSQSRAAVANRFVPVIWYGVLVLLATGIILTVGEPGRELENPMFRLKMLLIVVALALTAVFQRPLRAEPLYWDRSGSRRAWALTISFVSIAVWIGIVFAGRWIGYDVQY